MSLRWRITLYYAAISGLIVLLTVLSLLWVLRQSLHQALDDSLRSTAAAAISQINNNDFGFWLDPNPLSLSRLPGATVLLVYNSQGDRMDLSGRAPVSAPLQPGFTTIQGVRVFTQNLHDGGFVQVMRSEGEVNQTIRSVQQLALLGLPLLLLIGLALGYMLADRALKPVDEVSFLASNIARSGRYGERVPESSGKDEMARLTQTFNAMLSRLQETIERERAFALSAAHELKTPLAVLQGRTSLTLERERTPEQYQKALESLHQTSQELSETVEGLLALARSNQPAATEAIQLDFLALEAAETARPLARPKRIEFHLDLASAPTQGDPSTLRTAISNLINNAIKYGNEGSKVWLKTRSENGKALLEVADNGPGIPEGELTRLRQPFQRGRGLPSGNGSGLGLALVNSIAEQHGGKLVLGAAAEGGLLARLELPTLPFP